MRSARRIIDLALRFEAEGIDAGVAFDQACERVAGVAPGAVESARKTWAALGRRFSDARVDASIRSRDQRGRFAPEAVA